MFPLGPQADRWERAITTVFGLLMIVSVDHSAFIFRRAMKGFEMHTGLLLLSFVLLCNSTRLVADGPAEATAGTVDWNFTRLDLIGGHKTTLVGSPRLKEAIQEKVVEFDGQSAIFLNANPLAGMEQFTAEIVFQPYAGGAKEQRFLHFQEEGSDNRLLFEIRLMGDNRWFLDTFIKSGQGNYTLFAEKSPHELGPWYHAAVVMDGKTMRHFVNGVEELSTPITFSPQKDGRSSIGVRINQVSWYKGGVKRIRITPGVLPPEKFLKP